MTYMQITQTEKILNAVETWCRAQPGRRVALRHDGVHWRVTLDESRPQRGESLLDALAQAATVCSVENDMAEEIGE